LGRLSDVFVMRKMNHSELEMRAAEYKWPNGKKSSRRKVRALNIPKSAWNQSCIGVDGQKSERKQFKKLAAGDGVVVVESFAYFAR